MKMIDFAFSVASLCIVFYVFWHTQAILFSSLPMDTEMWGRYTNRLRSSGIVVMLVERSLYPSSGPQVDMAGLCQGEFIVGPVLFPHWLLSVALQLKYILHSSHFLWMSCVREDSWQDLCYSHTDSSVRDCCWNTFDTYHTGYVWLIFEESAPRPILS